MAVEYVINRDKKTVVAILKGTRFDALKSVAKCVDNNYNVSFGTDESGYSILISDMFVGKAKCSDDDVFDESIGKYIAKKKCMEKYYRAKDNAIKQWYSRAKDRMNRVEYFIKKAERSKTFNNQKNIAYENYYKALKDLSDAKEALKEIE